MLNYLELAFTLYAYGEQPYSSCKQQLDKSVNTREPNYVHVKLYLNPMKS